MPRRKFEGDYARPDLPAGMLALTEAERLLGLSLPTMRRYLSERGVTPAADPCDKRRRLVTEADVLSLAKELGGDTNRRRVVMALRRRAEKRPAAALIAAARNLVREPYEIN